MSRALPSTPDELRPTLMEVLEACPVDRCNPADCPLFSLRKMSRRARLHWFNALTPAEVEHLAAYHRVCMGLKLASRSPVQSQAAKQKLKIPKLPSISPR